MSETKEKKEFPKNIKRNPITEFRARILRILAEKKRTKAWLASEMKLSKQNLNYLLNHASKIKHIDMISKVLHVNPQWLSLGIGPVNISTEHLQPHHRVIPLLPWPQKASKEFIESLGQKPSEQQPCLIGELNLPANCFAMHLKSRSMEPIFKPGSLLIFDNRRSPQHQDYVLASFTETEELVFRQYLIKNDNHCSLHIINRSEIKTLNTGAFKVHGVLVQKRFNYSN